MIRKVKCVYGFSLTGTVKVVLPKTKSELARQINSLGQVEINVLEPIDKKNVGLVKSEIDRFVGNGQKNVSVVFNKNK